MTTRHSPIPPLDQYVSELLQQRRSDYLTELETLRKQLWHKNWLEECSLVIDEINHLTDLSLMSLVPSSNSFCALARVRSIYNRDVARIVSASGVKAQVLAKHQQDYREAIGQASSRLLARVFSCLGSFAQCSSALADKSAQTHVPSLIRMN